ncbi:hypothetical protein [Dietzia sp. 179-F 9C3 NHS]|uniref:hypothetical protein n=1 Tax=Dietzia sp. 179-F 9C3 NHS TaxID=3374295 RepID=UPI00387A18CE
MAFARRAAAVMAGTALAFSLASVPTAVAQSQTAGECALSDKRSWETALVGYELSNEWGGNGLVAPGQEIALTTTVTGAYHLVNELRQHHPAGFQPVKAEVSSYKFLGGTATWVNHTASMIKDGDTVRVRSAGWTTSGGQAAALRVTYKAPADAVPGTKFTSGGGASLVAASGQDFRDMNACVTIREKNAVESAQGSLEGIGAGSLVEGSTTSSNLSSDPASLISDVINGLDLGQLLGGAIGS